jgi:hypothetical protein
LLRFYYPVILFRVIWKLQLLGKGIIIQSSNEHFALCNNVSLFNIVRPSSKWFINKVLTL